MSWMDRVSYTERNEHPMLNTRDETSKNALAVMENAGALFHVRYPPATWGADDDGHPMVESGVNEGLPLYKWVVRSDTNEPLGLHSGTFAESGSYRYVGEMAENQFRVGLDPEDRPQLQTQTVVTKQRPTIERLVRHQYLVPLDPRDPQPLPISRLHPVP